jgi:hypothetical protein
MKRVFNWQTVLGISLIVLSALVYYFHFLVFRDAHHIFIYLVGDIAFVFIEVLMVTMVLHKLLQNREKKAMLKKLNMVIGVFFSEVGIKLLKLLSGFDANAATLKEKLIIRADCSVKDFNAAKNDIRQHVCEADTKKGDLQPLRKLLTEKRQFLVNLLENPNILEHESFTDLLWAVFHLAEELSLRNDLSGLPDTDYKHLALDITRSQKALLREWVSYMKHLKADYPYLFSLAVRTNPFDAKASVEVR